jgi:predicted PurR-regulated permease PerM
MRLLTVTNTSIIRKLLLLFLVLGGLYYAKAFLMPLCVGGIFATLLLPLCRTLENRKVPRVLAVLLCLFIFLAVVAGIGTLVIWQFSELANNFALIRTSALEMVDSVQLFIVNHFGISIKVQARILHDEQPSIAGLLQFLLGSLAYVVTTFVLFSAYIFLFLYYRTHLRIFLMKLIPPAQKEEMEKVLQGVTHVSQHYLLGMAKMIFLLWIMYGIGFSLIGVKNAIFFAILCGLLEIIPYLGNIIGTTLTLFVAFVNGASPLLMLGILGTYAVVQFIQGWILEPIILGPHVKLNPFATIVALVLGNLLWGISGIFLAIPLVAMLKIVFDHIASLKPYGFLMGQLSSTHPKPADPAKK